MTSLSLKISGAKGGSAKARTPVEEPNTLRSTSKGRILDLIAHGPIVGLANGLQSVYLDDTPLQNPDGSFNFKGVTVTTREGYPDQDPIAGFREVENPIEVSTEVKYDTPIVRSVSNDDADAAVVVIQLSSLVSNDPKTGDSKAHEVSIAIDTRVNGGEWVTKASDTISGKTISPYQRTYRVDLDKPGEREVRVRRVSADETTSYKQSATHWITMTEVVDARLSYPDSALVGLELDSKLFGNQMPSRSYDVKLSVIKVPSNYDPETRSYTGMWDGTFKQAWTDNPAWIYYDLATHPTIGAGLSGVDKWALYSIGQYCDELVPDGYGGMEPRFTCNTLFADREEAITTLTTLAGVFRGMTYWGTDTVVPVADMPGDPKKLVTPSNVINGDFEYQGTPLKDRHSVAIVMWNDPEDSHKAKPEFVEDPDSIDQFGWRETQVTAFACSSRGQAHRLGAWILYSERMETQAVTYSAATDHADLRPGDIIELSDPDRAGARLGGRILETGLSTLTLDKVPDEVGGATWYLAAVIPSGVVERKQVSLFEGSTVTLLESFSQEPVVGAVWVLSSAAVTPPQYRVASVEEQEDGTTYRITATEYDPNKYDIVEQELRLPETSHSLIPTGPLAPPLDITAEVYTYLAGGTEHQGLTISWTPGDDPRIVDYVAEVWGPEDSAWRTAYSGPAVSFDVMDAVGGQWMIRVQSVASTGTGSAWSSRTVNISDLLQPAPPDTVDVEVGTFSVSLYPRGVYPGAMYEFWRSASALTDDLIESNAVRLSVSTNLADTGLRSDTTYYYYIRGANAYGVSAWYPVQATTLADFEDILSAVDEDIRRPGGLFEEMVGAIPDSVAQDAAAIVQGSLDEVRSDLDEARSEIAAATSDIEVLESGITSLEVARELENIRYLASVALHEGISARSTTEEVVRADDDSALASQITTLEATVNESISAAITQEQIARVDADSALSSQITTLESTLNGNISSAISQEQFARADADSALSAQITQLEATVNEDISAALTQEQIARADGDSALSAQITSLSSSTSNQFASIELNYSTKTYADGAVARAVTTATVGGQKAVFGISVDGEVAEIGAIADRFYVYNPVAGSYTLAFAVVNGQTVIQDALIRDASITTAKIADLAITMAKISDSLQSDNYVEGQSGWRITKGGEFEINGSVAGGGRVKITNQLFEVFDGNGTRRVRLGIWS